MTPNIMRQLWSVVESTHAKTLLNMDDASLVQLLVKQTKTKASLDGNEADYLSDYVQSRLALIRNVAQERLYF
ncbi:hypothetical protein [Brunnivagina elsteri]|uniref:Uncharacterized protein n=1 Tax=Brunnivagina elsteri CCALA 953 TaxID=987040 RepID=A0A2A2TJP7_9CYAN|nr:hypothetical protein [Calothrix elsteri]PAX55900.1 hypothetical protein CK510_10835 [Calothrix elsteri CCALA 953]